MDIKQWLAAGGGVLALVGLASAMIQFVRGKLDATPFVDHLKRGACAPREVADEFVVQLHAAVMIGGWHRRPFASTATASCRDSC